MPVHPEWSVTERKDPVKAILLVFIPRQRLRLIASKRNYPASTRFSLNNDCVMGSG